MRTPARRVTVARTASITPHLRRITFTGPELAGFHPGSPASYLKLYLPPDGQSDLVLPTFGPRGPIYPEGVPRPIARTYTPRAHRPDVGELDIEFVLHGHGPASDWAARAEPGAVAGITDPGSGYDPDPAAPWFVIAGDESALPAMATIVEALPAGRTAHVVVEIPDDADRIDLTSPARLITTWRARGDRPAGSLLEAELRAMHVPRGEGRFWVATESSVVRRIRDHLVTDRAVPRSRFVVRAYWNAGAGEDPEAV